jgi:ABC-2 type transport system ATP-binding protein
MATSPIAAKSTIGYLPEGAPAYADMTPAQLLGFVASVRGLSGSTLRAAVGNAIDRLQLHDVVNKRIETLSKGFKRRVGLAQAILHDPPVLVMDEPTDGLDPNQKHEVRSLIREMAADKAIILSTHILEEVEAVCTRAIVIARGTLLFDGTPLELEARSRHYGAVTLALRGVDHDTAAAALSAIDGVGGIEKLDASDDDHVVLRAFPQDGANIFAAVGDAARQNNWSVDELRSERGRLDDVFRDITTSNGAAS